MSTKRDGDPSYDKAELDEPIFVLRAQDTLAPSVVEFWVQVAKARGVPPHKIEDAWLCAVRMRRWQKAHGSKMPD